MDEITITDAIEAIRSGVASYGGTTHSDHNGYCAIITRHDLQTTQHVIDVSDEDGEQLKEAANAKA